MNKKIIAMGTIIGCLSVVHPAFAENIDMSAMSMEDLIALRDSIAAEIISRGGDNTIGIGVYEVGTDIKASDFKVTAMKGTDGYTTFTIFKDREEYDEYNAGNYDLGEIGELYGSEDTGYDTGNLNLKDGEILYVERGEAIIEETKNSWKP